MEVRASVCTGISRYANHLPFCYVGSFCYHSLRKVKVICCVAVPVVNIDGVECRGTQMGDAIGCSQNVDLAVCVLICRSIVNSWMPFVVKSPATSVIPVHREDRTPAILVAV